MKALQQILLLNVLLIGIAMPGKAQSDEAQQLLLNVAKLTELKKILTDLKKGYEIVSQGYNTIKDLSQGNFNLHKGFLDGLMTVSPEVKNYKRVADIINYQLLLVKEYKVSFKKIKQDQNFNEDEISYVARVYRNLFEGSLKNLDQLATIITSNKLRMSDDERMEGIDRVFNDMQEKLSFLRYFNNSTTILAVQRAKEKRDVLSMQSAYGITK